MRIFIPALVLALAAVWPQTACAEHEHDTTEQPPVITMKWTGLVPAINLVRDPGDALHSASEQFLVIVVVTGANIEWENYLVTLSADHEAKAEAETRGGVALFTLPVDFPIQQTLAVQVRRTHYSPLPSELVIQYEPDLIPNALAEAEEESSLIFRPHVRLREQQPARTWAIYSSSYYYQRLPPPTPLPLAVEILIVPATDTAKTKDLPGFAAKFACLPKASNVLQRFTLDLIPTTDLPSCFWNMESGDAYFTRPFSLKSPGSKTFRSQRLPGPRSERQPLDGCLLTECELVFGTTAIHAVDWRKGKADDSCNFGVAEECRLLVPLDKQEPEVLIIRNNLQTPPRNSSVQGMREAMFSFWVDLFR